MSFPKYPKYKDSGVEWLGEVPEHWGIQPFKHLVDIQNGADHKHIEQPDGYPVIGSGGVFAFASEFMYDGEAVLLGRKGTIDKPLYVNELFWTVDTMYWAKIMPNVCGRYAYYTALTIPFDFYSTNTALPSMTKGTLNAHRVMFPSLAEQTAIAAFLDRETAKIDGLVAEQRRLMELLKEKRQAVISHAVTKGLNPNAPMKPSGIEWLGDVPEHWRVIPLRWVSTCCSGDGLPADECETVEDAEHAVPVIGGNGLMGFTSKGNCTHSQLAVGRVGALCGNVHIVPSPAWVTDNALMLDLNPNIAGLEFVHAVLVSRRLNDIASKTAQPLITGTQVSDQRLPIPPKREQGEIVQFLQEITGRFDALTAEADRAISLLQERRTALISAAVTGKIDVRGLSAAGAG